MGIMDFIRGEFIDVIEWVDETQDTILWKFPRFQNAIKNGAQLTVRESQVAVLMDEGKFADVYGPGRHELSTANMPLLTTLRSWKHGFNSPFKVDVYFVNTKQFLNQRWGTKNPIMLRDPEFGPIRVRAFGSFCFKADEDPRKLITTIVGTNPEFTTESVSEQIRNYVITHFTNAVAESKVPVLDMASNLLDYSGKLQEALKPSLEQYGLQLTTFLVENISLPENVQEALDRRSSMSIIGAGNMNTYTQMQFADSLNRPGGGGEAGGMAQGAMGMGMGFAMAGQMAQAFAQPQQGMAGQGGAVPPPPPAPGVSPSFFVLVNGAQQGPFALQQLSGMAQQGTLAAGTLVWCAGMPQWSAAGQVPALAALFAPPPAAGTPPPAPTPPPPPVV